MGCLLSCVLYLRKDVHYPLLRNCHDIVEYVTENKEGKGGKGEKGLEGALFVLERLS